ncbi:MAG: pilus assembly protein [Gemmatimonadetes bacterium]|nr:pilus assembly protein [Gemmatimonadota bacterium]
MVTDAFTGPGQALVEFALLAPVLLFTILGGIEVAFLLTDRDAQARDTGVVADYAAANPDDASWHALAALRLPGCAVEVDRNPPGPPGYVVASATCQYQPVATHGLWDGLPISTEAAAADNAPSPVVVPSPSPSPST